MVCILFLFNIFCILGENIVYMISTSQLCDKNHPRAKLLCSRQEHQLHHALQLEDKGLPGGALGLCSPA